MASGIFIFTPGVDLIIVDYFYCMCMIYFGSWRWLVFAVLLWCFSDLADHVALSVRYQATVDMTTKVLTLLQDTFHFSCAKVSKCAYCLATGITITQKSMCPIITKNLVLHLVGCKLPGPDELLGCHMENFLVFWPSQFHHVLLKKTLECPSFDLL